MRVGKWRTIEGLLPRDLLVLALNVCLHINLRVRMLLRRASLLLEFLPEVLQVGDNRRLHFSVLYRLGVATELVFSGCGCGGTLRCRDCPDTSLVLFQRRHTSPSRDFWRLVGWRVVGCVSLPGRWHRLEVINVKHRA